MRMVEIEDVDLGACLKHSQKERLILAHEGKPIALLVGVEGLDEEQLELGQDEEFWRTISRRRTERTTSREEMELRLNITSELSAS